MNQRDPNRMKFIEKSKIKNRGYKNFIHDLSRNSNKILIFKTT